MQTYLKQLNTNMFEVTKGTSTRILAKYKKARDNTAISWLYYPTDIMLYMV